MITLPNTGAIFNEPERTRRYWLGRDLWRSPEDDALKGRLLIVACNPSTADETANDPTIAKEIKFGRAWGYRYLDKVNVYDWRATDPEELKDCGNPVSPENETYILAAAARADLIVCAWGANGALLARGARTRRLLRDQGYTLHHLGLNKDGSPKHPLYLKDSTKPEVWA